MARVRFYGGKAHGAVRIGDHVNLNLGEVINLGNKTYEWDDGGGVGAGNVAVLKGADAAADIVALRDAINANKPTPGVTASVDPVDTATLRIIADARGAAGNLALTTDMADADNIVSGAALVGGENAGSQTMARGSYVVTALDVLATSVVIPTGLTSPRFPQVERRRAGELLEAVTGLLTISGGNILHDFAGATDLEAGDVLDWVAWE